MLERVILFETLYGYSGGTLKTLGYCLLVLVLALSMSLFVVEKSFALAPDAPLHTAKETIQTPANNLPADAKEEEIKYQKLRAESQEHVSLFSPAKVFSNLFTLIAIFVALAWFYNKYGKDYLNKNLPIKKITKNAINVLSTASIGQGKFLHIVEVDGEKILIGATANNISLLKELKSTNTEKVVSDE